jgi:hypothetical protein
MPTCNCGSTGVMHSPSCPLYMGTGGRVGNRTRDVPECKNLTVKVVYPTCECGQCSASVPAPKEPKKEDSRPTVVSKNE